MEVARPCRCTSEKRKVPFFRGSVWALGTFWKGDDNIATTGIRPPDRPAYIESL